MMRKHGAAGMVRGETPRRHASGGATSPESWLKHQPPCFSWLRRGGRATAYSYIARFAAVPLLLLAGLGAVEAVVWSGVGSWGVFGLVVIGGGK